MTPIKFDKRLYDKHLKSGELSRDDLATYKDELPDLSAELRHRAVEGEESTTDMTPEAESETHGGSDEQG